MLITFLIIVHVLLCLALIFLVLLQQGKGADLGAVFGNSNSVFGTNSIDNVGKITTALAIIFMITSILLVRTYIYQAKDSTFANKATVTTQANNQDKLEGSVLDKVNTDDTNKNNIDILDESVNNEANEIANKADNDTVNNAKAETK